MAVWVRAHMLLQAPSEPSRGIQFGMAVPDVVVEVVTNQVFLGHTCADLSIAHDQLCSSSGLNRIP